MRYALARWNGLTFLYNGRIELDTNPVERAIGPVALGRKNHLFAGSDNGGARWATLYALIETCTQRRPDAHGRRTPNQSESKNCCRGLGRPRITSK